LKDRVSVLLATYNGSKFLLEQLQSIEAQTLAPTRITVRDDGSTDDTIHQVEDWAAGKSNVILLCGKRLGAIDNFFELLRQTDEDSDYFSFCDQDDVWVPEKLERAVARLRICASTVPTMYCSRVEYVDEKLHHLGWSRIPRLSGFANALVENIAMGCTVVLNRQARALICGRLPRKALMHDWWCYLVLSALGEVIYDDRPGIKYRQHRNNVVGGTSALLELFKRRMVRFLKRPPNSKLLSDQAAGFQQCFGDILAPQESAVLERFLTVKGTLWARLSYNAAMDVWRQSWVDTAILRTMIVLGRV
jgi:glycosyltransferase involved in cell wall biosynthesis